MKKALKASFAALVMAASGLSQADLIVTTTTDATALANTLGGSGITISNATLTGSSTQQGTFTGGASAGIGIDSGVILTSGSATIAPGPNNEDGAGYGLGTPGDGGLSTLAGNVTNDANILQFNFTSTTGSLFFSYVFASEEYNEWVDAGYNDVFAFYVDGVNIALIPGTSTPVAIDNVNCGNPYNAPSGGTNCSLFNNNDLDDGLGAIFNLEYDGFTDVFLASVTGLAPGTHTIRLAIADTGDTVLDSAVFLQAGSFSSTPPNGSVPEPATLALLALGLAGLGFARRRKQ